MVEVTVITGGISLQFQLLRQKQVNIAIYKSISIEIVFVKHKLRKAEFWIPNSLYCT